MTCPQNAAESVANLKAYMYVHQRVLAIIPHDCAVFDAHSQIVPGLYHKLNCAQATKIGAVLGEAWYNWGVAARCAGASVAHDTPGLYSC